MPATLHTPELLSPAGNWDCARAAIAGGADAIYFGLPQFNARLRADNFTNGDLPELMAFLHKHGVRGFVAMNTLIFPGELDAAEEQLRHIAASGVDALIIQDIGLAKMAREIAPNVELHASTQMTITSPEGLVFVESLFPLERAVLARELSVREISHFTAHKTDHPGPTTPLEVFVHGALCVAYSGQCLTSESLGQRSANRGECAQACRMPYQIVVDGVTRDLGEHRYLLSPQDLAAVDLIPDLVRAGVKSFKIEGRLKSPEYVASVTRIYRKALDAAIHDMPSPVDGHDRYALEMAFSRGLSTGWLAGTNHPYLTHGRFGKKRGPLIGTIANCGNGWVVLAGRPNVPLAAGDGVVFDAGENRDHEQGARIWGIDDDGCLVFHSTYSGLDFERIKPGQLLWKTSDPKLESETRKFWQNAKLPEIKTPLHIIVTGRPGEPLMAEVELPDGSSLALGSDTLLAVAETRPLADEMLQNSFGRLGDTTYQLASLENRLEGPCILPVSSLNRLRRALVAALDACPPATPPALAAATDFSHISLLPAAGPADPERKPALAVLCRTLPQVEAALASGVSDLYCDFEDPRRYKDAVALVREGTSSICLATPRILKPGEAGYFKLIDRAEPDGVLLRNLGALHHYLARTDFIRIGDFSLNVANPITARLLREAAGLDRLTVSYDLNISQVLDLLAAAPPDWFELTLHQHMPLFHMEHCVFCAFLTDGTTWKDCGRPCETHVVHLRDRVGQLHRLMADVGCRNTLFNGRAQTGARFFPALRAAGLSRFRVELLDEDRIAAERTITAYQSLVHGQTDAFRLLDQVEALEKLGVTEGTLEVR
jgi:putative protease